MIKSLPIILTAILIAGVTVAQPVITLQEVTPEFGTSFTVQSGMYTDPGDPGANQNWNLSAMFAQNPSSSTYQSPDGLPGSELFPTATHVATSAMIGSPHTYFAFENNQVNELGFTSATPNVTVETVFTDSKMQVQFPLEYGDTFSDTYASETENIIFFNEDTTEAYIVESGSYEAEVDGYGTLTTPSGNYENVLRITFQIESDFTVTTDGVETGSGERVITETKYYKAGYPIPLASLSTTTTYSMGDVVDQSSSGSYLSELSVGLSESESPFTDLQLFPVPAQSHLNVSIELENAKRSQFSLIATDGKEVHAWPAQNLSTGEQQVVLALPQLGDGIYLFRVQTDAGVASRQLVIGR